MERSGRSLKLALAALLFFIALRSISFIQSNQQQKIIVYNVPQKTAIDFVNGRDYVFVGANDLLADDFARNFHLKPSRILYRINESADLDELVRSENLFTYKKKNILLVDETTSFDTTNLKPIIDLLVIAKSPKLYMNKLTRALQIQQVVFDGSVPAWKTKYWKKDCDSLKIPWHDVTTQGAFVMKMD